MHQQRVEPLQHRRVAKDQVPCPFARIGRPGGGGGKAVEQLGTRRVKLVRDAVPMLSPTDLDLLIQPWLRPREILNPGKTIVLAHILQACSVHLPGQPFPSLQADLHRKGKPGLKARVHETEHGMNPVVVKKEALAQPRHQLKLLRLLIAVDLKLRQGSTQVNPQTGPLLTFGWAAIRRANASLSIGLEAR